VLEVATRARQEDSETIQAFLTRYRNTVFFADIRVGLPLWNHVRQLSEALQQWLKRSPGFTRRLHGVNDPAECSIAPIRSTRISSAPD